MFNKTYVLNISKNGLHNWSLENGVKYPSNQADFGKVLVRAPVEPANVVTEWGNCSELGAYLSGEEAFGLSMRVCMRRSRSTNADGSKVRPRQIRSEGGGIPRGEVFQFICRNAGLKAISVKPLNGFEPDVKAIRGFEIHGVECLNTFFVTGTFKVDVETPGAAERFIKAYNEGIGSRKTYGCGLMVIAG